jgi:hypothetical protein
VLSKGAMCKQRFGAVLSAKVWCSVRVLCGAKQKSKGSAWCLVPCKDKVRVPSR